MHLDKKHKGIKQWQKEKQVWLLKSSELWHILQDDQ